MAPGEASASRSRVRVVSHAFPRDLARRPRLTVAYEYAIMIREIPDGHVGVVERFGRYRCLIDPGLHFLVPFADVLARVYPTGVDEFDVRCRARSADGRPVTIDARVAYQIVDPLKVAYGVASPWETYRALAERSLQ